MPAVGTPEKLSREEIAQREIGRTDIAPGLAWLLTVLFLLTLVMPPTVQVLYEIVTSERNEMPVCFELFQALPEVPRTFHHTEGSLWNKVVAANRHLLVDIEEYERKLSEKSLITQYLLGPTQECLTRLTGLGNEKTYVGRDGWLFYRSDVDYLTGPGFLDPAVLQRRAVSGKQHVAPPQPDPRPAILEFHEQLSRRGIRLILLPMPSKPAIHPEQLSSRFKGYSDPLENSSFRQFKAEMDQAGVLVFDPAPILKRAGKTDAGSAQFLRTDTHWNTAGMERVAKELPKFIEHHCPLPPMAPVRFRQRAHEVRNLGDIAGMLHLPREQTLFAPEQVGTLEVIQPDGRQWQSDAQADVLLLGDSYTNVFSLPEMNWGTAAGLAERLSFALHRPVDRIAQNDGGSHAVRQALYQQLARGEDRLSGKRVVIWEFAARELAFGDWKSFPMPDITARRTPSDESSSAGQILVTARVRDAAGAPEPGSVPYRDAVSAVHFDSVHGLKGHFEHGEIIAYIWGLRDNRRTPVASYVPNQNVTLRLTPWKEVRDKYERFNRIELDDPDFKLIDLPVYWAEEIP